MSTKKKVTPMMQQFNDIKEEYPDVVLLFRCGDFYETYMDDAVRASEILGITLTRRSNKNADSVQMAGFPHHALDTYLPKIVRRGLRVAICDQLEDPKQAKGLVKRGVTELVTPGVSTNDNMLNVKENNFLASVCLVKKQYGLSLLDISTGEFLVSEGDHQYIEKLMNNFSPKEVLIERGQRKQMIEFFGNHFLWQEQDDWIFTKDAASDRLYEQFETRNMKGYGVEHLDIALIAAGSILYYMDQTHHKQLGHITNISRIETDRYVWLDRFTVRNLELFGSQNANARSLISVIDKTVTPMGGRMMNRWLNFPLKEVKSINDRLSVVEYLFRDLELKDTVEEYLLNIGDLERITSKVAVNRISPREVAQLRVALESTLPIKQVCEKADNVILNKIGKQLNPCIELRDKIFNELSSNPPILINKGNVIAAGVSPELDELRQIAYNGKDYLLKLQQRESENTGIPSLKIGYNNVFGYYIEVRNTHKDKVPDEWIRKQTLVSAERYITEELKEYETQILGAEDKILALEVHLFDTLVKRIMLDLTAIQVNCQLLAQIDCLVSFMKVSQENHYFKPIIDDSHVLDIKEGRHPVIEKQLPVDEPYIPNDVFLDNETQQIIIITGPNMSGKSALLRQTALIVLMAQMGCYVPADFAHIGVVDKIFTRVGANDNISAGDSTFMVEMNEASSILNNLSNRSLVLFDELGRGTSTYDGISIAWAIVEYIHQHHKTCAKTLFATHYHELNEMANHFNRIKNYNVSVKELDKKIIFLRKLVEGGSEHSFGIHVAKMAGMPKNVTKRADEILLQLEDKNKQNIGRENLSKIVQKSNESKMQLQLFSLDDPLLENVRDLILNVDIDHLTPIDALMKLSEIKKVILGKSK